MPAFAALSFAWDVGARRTAGLGKVTGPGLLRYLGGLAGSFAALPLLAYLATWTGWFATSSGYDRNWAQLHGVNIPVISPLISLLQYNKAMLAFNTGLQKHHPYQSQPWTWLTISRPVSYYWSCPTSGHGVCAKGDAAEVLAIGTPVLWWGAILALLVCLGWWLTRRDWRAGAVLVGVAAGWLPWFGYAKRTQFYFYSVAFVPFLVLADHAVPRPGHGFRHGEPCPARGGRVPGRRLRARGAAQLRLPVPVADRPGHPVPLLAGPHVVPRLDLARPHPGRAGPGRRTARGPHPRLKTNLQETFSIVAYNRITRPGRGKLPGTRATLGLANVYMGERRYEAE